MESRKKNKLIKSLRDAGALVQHIDTNGWPDILLIHQKFSGLIEFKDTETKLEKHQEYTIGEITHRGFPVLIARFRDDCSALSLYNPFIDSPPTITTDSNAIVFLNVCQQLEKDFRYRQWTRMFWF